MISRDGNHTSIKLGADILEGEVPQVVVPGGVWFAARVLEPENYSLVGCTVAPGFDFKDFELAERENILKEFPQHEKIIRKLTRA